MLYKIETEIGSIAIRKPVVGKIIQEAVNRQSGRVFLSNHKGKLLRLKSRHGSIDTTDFMDITMDGKHVDLRIYITLKFGTSISMITEQLIKEIKSDIEGLAGIEANSIAIVVTGILAKQMKKRNIEIKG